MCVRCQDRFGAGRITSFERRRSLVGIVTRWHLYSGNHILQGCNVFWVTWTNVRLRHTQTNKANDVRTERVVWSLGSQSPDRWSIGVHVLTQEGGSLIPRDYRPWSEGIVYFEGSCPQDIGPSVSTVEEKWRRKRKSRVESRFPFTSIPRTRGLMGRGPDPLPHSKQGHWGKVSSRLKRSDGPGGPTSHLTEHELLRVRGRHQTGRTVEVDGPRTETPFVISSRK